MARMKTKTATAWKKQEIGLRLAQLRSRMCIHRLKSIDGSGFVAWCERLGTNTRTWQNWEDGQAIAPEQLLRVIVEMGVSPPWLLNGDGPMMTAMQRGHFDPESNPWHAGKIVPLGGL